MIRDSERSILAVLFDQINRAAEGKAVVDGDGVADAARIAFFVDEQTEGELEETGHPAFHAGGDTARPPSKVASDRANLFPPDALDCRDELFSIFVRHFRHDLVQHYEG